MKATMLLKRDHATVNQLFTEFEKAKDGDQREDIFERIRNEVEVHATAEEELLYPECRKISELEDRTKEAIHEHRMVRQLIFEIRKMDASDDDYVDKVLTLRDNIRHHVEEEENEIFPVLKKHLSEDRLEDLGTRIEERKTALAKKSRKALAPA